jgi:hypothetical protein
MLNVNSVDDVELYERRFTGMTVPAEVKAARDELDTAAHQIAFGTFFTYSVD